MIMEMEPESKLKPPRISIVKIVFKYLQEKYDEGNIMNLKFDEVNARVRAVFPDSRFNPYHLAHYKHKFLVRMDYVKMNKNYK